MKFPSLLFEKRIWKQGVRFIAGCDEVGRGSFAGPVVAGCVVFPDNQKLFSSLGRGIKINDSKKLTSRQREISCKWIKENCLAWGIGEVSVSVINRIGISKATKIAFRRSIKDANKRLWGKIEFLLIDAFFLPYTKGLKKKNQIAIKKGDEKCFSIAAASIVAKVCRDRLMRKLGETEEYKKYGWSQNKGYGTRKHRDALIKYGITRYHRKRFVQTFLEKRI